MPTIIKKGVPVQYFNFYLKKLHVYFMAVAPVRRAGPRTTIIVGDPNQGEDIRAAQFVVICFCFFTCFNFCIRTAFRNFFTHFIFL